MSEELVFTLENSCAESKPTGNLRWLVNPGTNIRGPKLQQEVFITEFGSRGAIGGHAEWRDVETVVSEVPFQ